MKATLLIEIGVEELPPNAMRPLADAFAGAVATGLRNTGLDYASMACFATPRRLAVALANVPDRAAPVAVEKAGPTLAIALDDNGNPTAAAQGFARSLGTTVDALAREDSDKGERLVYRATEAGKTLSALLQTVVDAALKALPIPKLMRWGDGEDAFVRPVHWVVALHGIEILALQVFGASADRVTYGHRFHHPGSILLENADDYAAALTNPGYVMADPDARRARVLGQVEAAAAEFGGRALIDDALVEEVTALVEWPMGIAGVFDARFLTLPREVLVSTLQTHQRYFPIEDDAGDLQAGFVTVANIESRDVARVIAGNERVVRPRLADALFFWEQDRRCGLAGHIDGLARVSFQKELGSLADKSERIRVIGTSIASAWSADPSTVERAAILSKTDLLTEMVGEFPDLQGVMGRYYALDAGEPSAVANALQSQYAPARSGAAIAPDTVGQVLSVADRLDTLAGIFAINQRPGGDKDPFGLRRAALGVLRTLIEGNISLDLAAALRFAVDCQPVAVAPDTVEALWMFHMERLRGYYAEKNIQPGCFDAVAATGVVDLRDFDRRLQAVAAFSGHAAARVVCGAHKRIRNILRRNTDQSVSIAVEPDALVDDAEKTLAAAWSEHAASVENASRQGDYQAALQQLAELAAPLDAFFDQVMVISDDPRLRANRVALLGELDALCRRVADMSCLSLE